MLRIEQVDLVVTLWPRIWEDLGSILSWHTAYAEFFS
jgi:hypothetical protein